MWKEFINNFQDWKKMCEKNKYNKINAQKSITPKLS